MSLSFGLIAHLPKGLTIREPKLPACLDRRRKPELADAAGEFGVGSFGAFNPPRGGAMGKLAIATSRLYFGLERKP